MRRNRRLIFQQNARQYLQTLTLNERESAETIRQGIWQMRNLLDSRVAYSERDETHREIEQFNFHGRRFEIGQWVDVKDTIDQWVLIILLSL